MTTPSPSKSAVTTKEALRLISSGWKLKTHKDKNFGHLYYLHNESRQGFAGSCRYINKDIYNNIKKSLEEKI